MYKRKRAGNTITRKINSTKDTAAKADKNHYISNSYLEGFIPIDTEYFTASQSLKTEFLRHPKLREIPDPDTPQYIIKMVRIGRLFCHAQNYHSTEPVFKWLQMQEWGGIQTNPTPTINIEP